MITTQNHITSSHLNIHFTDQKAPSVGTLTFVLLLIGGLTITVGNCSINVALGL